MRIILTLRRVHHSRLRVKRNPKVFPNRHIRPLARSGAYVNHDSRSVDKLSTMGTTCGKIPLADQLEDVKRNPRRFFGNGRTREIFRFGLRSSVECASRTHPRTCGGDEEISEEISPRCVARSECSASLRNVPLVSRCHQHEYGGSAAMPSPTQLAMFGPHLVIGPMRTFAIGATGAIWCDSCRDSHEPAIVGSTWSADLARLVNVWRVCRWCEFVCESCDELRHRDDAHQCDRCEECSDCCSCAYCSSCDESHDPYDMCRDCEYCSSCCSCEDEEYCSCEACGGDPDENTDDIDAPVTYAAGMLSAIGRTFGAELEIVGMGPRRAAAVIAAAGLPTAGYVGYRHDMCDVWKVVTDSSVNGGCEVVSPILRGDDGMEQLRVAMLALSANGATVDRQCGTHIHHGMPDATGPDLARVVKFYDASHAAIDAWHAPSRRGRSDWSGPNPSDLSALETAETCESAKSAAHRLPRYCSVNVTAFPKYETVEFRQHGGTLDFLRLSAWVRTGQALIAAALDGAAGTNVPDALADTLRAYGATSDELARMAVTY